MHFFMTQCKQSFGIVIIGVAACRLLHAWRLERDVIRKTQDTHVPIIVQTNCVFDSLHSVTTPLLGIVIYQTVVTLGSICISRSSLGV
jgi:predicted nucleotidyltransferase